MVAVMDVCDACVSEEGRTEGVGRGVQEVSDGDEKRCMSRTLYGRLLGFLDYEEGIPSN